MQKYLVVEVGTDPAAATSLALANDCCGFYTGVPESMAAQAAAEGWTLPCVLTDDGTGFISGWAPA